MLKELLDRKIKAQGLSIRATAREIGVAHTTVIRTLEGEPLDVPTLIKFCRWLGVAPSTVLDAEAGIVDATTASIASITQSVPGLARILEDAVKDLESGELTADDLEEIMTYIAFKVQARKKR